MENNQYIYTDASPYPVVKVKSTNRFYAREMLSNIGACNSEMSAVSLYFYNSLVTSNLYEEVAACFHQVMLVEMHHLEIFGKLAQMLGADPRLWRCGRGNMMYWTPGCNQYPRRLNDLLRNAIVGEQEAIAKYSRQAECIRDPYIVENLNRIILDEQHHIAIFQGLWESYVG